VTGELFSAILFGFTGAYIFYFAFRKLVLKHRIMGLATSRIRGMAMGLVEVAGVADLEGELRDPIYMQPCAYFHIHVEQYRRHGKGGSWQTVYRSDSTGRGFYCRDSTGKVLILPDKPELYFAMPIKRENGLLTAMFSSSVDDEAMVFLRTKASGQCRLTAYILRKDDPLYVLGYARPLPTEMRAGAGIALADAAARLKKEKPQIPPGDWDMELAKFKKEWDAAHKKDIPDADTISTSFISRYAGVTMVLANCEDDAVSKLGWGSVFGVIVGAALMMLSVFFVLQKL
jgi:hypothetical protein